MEAQRTRHVVGVRCSPDSDQAGDAKFLGLVPDRYASLLSTTCFLFSTSCLLIPCFLFPYFPTSLLPYFLLPTSYFIFPTSLFVIPTCYYLLLASYCLLLTTYYLLLPASRVPLPTYNSLLTHFWGEWHASGLYLSAMGAHSSLGAHI